MENNNENTEQYTPLEDSVTTTEPATINEPETTESANYSSYSLGLPSEETVSEDSSSSSSEEIDFGNYNKPMDLSYFDTPKIAEDDKKREDSAGESQDYSWLENVSDKDIYNLLNEKIEKSNVEPTNIWGKLEETAKNSPMYAKAGIPTELNNPETHEQIKKDPLEEPGLFSEEEKKDIRSMFKKPNTAQKVFGKASEFLIPFAGKTIKETIAPEPMKNKEAYVDALVRFKKNNPLGYAESKKALDEAYEGSKKGSFTHGLDYYSLTGDTNGNAFAESIDKIIKELPEDTPKEVIDNILNPDPITRERINNLSMEAEKNEKVKALAIEEATIGITSLALGLAAPYIKTGLGKIIEKIPEDVSNKLTEKLVSIALHDGKGKAFWNNLLKKEIDAGGKTFRIGDFVSIQNLKKRNVKLGGVIREMYNQGITDPDTALQIIIDLRKALEEASLMAERGEKVGGVITAGAINRLIADAVVDSGLAKKTAIATGITAGAMATAGALSTGIPDENGRQINSRDIVSYRQKNPYKGDNAVTLRTNEGTATVSPTGFSSGFSTGIPDENGRQINSRDIVSHRQKNPYKGDNAVTLRTNEGTATVSPPEAVMVGEAEHLTPEMGYTEDVIKSAEGSEIIPTEKDNDYGFDFSNAEMKAGYYDKDGKYIGEYPERSFLTKVGDVFQAILGGKDINNDKTISAREWYDSTLGKLFKGTANVISSLSPKNIKNTVDKLGQKLSDSLPGVYDMKTGNVYINQDYKGSLPISPGEAKVKIRNVLGEMLPSYSDSTAQSAKKELIGNVIGLPIYNLPGQIASKFIGNYITSIADEIVWLQSGKRMEPGQKYATNLVITNGVMSAFDPLSSVANLLSEAKGLETGAKIESKFNGQLLLPYDEVYINFSSAQEDKPYAASSVYGTSDETLNANGKYSGYREQAKDSNLAKNYNEGMEKETNEAVSDKYVKIFKTILHNEPEHIRKVLMEMKR